MNKSLASFTQELDRKMLDHGGRLYLAKDAMMSPETFAASYPRKDEFMELRGRLDPENILSSNLARPAKPMRHRISLLASNDFNLSRHCAESEQ